MEIKQTNKIILIMGWLFTLIGLISIVPFSLLIVSMYDQLSQAGVVIFMPIMMPCIFAIIGIAFLLNYRKKAKLIKRLKNDGKRYFAELINLYQNPKFRVNGRYPYVVECAYINGQGESVLVKSMNLWPDRFLRPEEITIEVYVNTSNPMDYYVCVSYNKVFPMN